MPDDPGLPISSSEYVDLIEQTVRQQLTKLGLSGLIKAKVTSTAGAIELPGETSTTRGPKTMLMVQSRPLAVDDIVLVSYDTHDSYLILGKIIDPAAFESENDSTTWRAVAWVKPGDTNTRDSANTEQTTASTTYVTKKRFRPGFPGEYRFTFDLRRDAAVNETASAQIVILTSSGDVIVASAAATTNSSSYVAKTLNMTVQMWGGDEVAVQIKIGGATSLAYIQNVVIKYDVATADPTINHAVLQD